MVGGIVVTAPGVAVVVDEGRPLTAAVGAVEKVTAPTAMVSEATTATARPCLLAPDPDES